MKSPEYQVLNVTSVWGLWDRFPSRLSVCPHLPSLLRFFCKRGLRSHSPVSVSGPLNCPISWDCQQSLFCVCVRPVELFSLMRLPAVTLLRLYQAPWTVQSHETASSHSSVSVSGPLKYPVSWDCQQSFFCVCVRPLELSSLTRLPAVILLCLCHAPWTAQSHETASNHSSASVSGP
jgi:hypothetical protein